MKYLLLLDYDGTLTPIVRHPKDAILSSARRKILNRLAHHPEIKMAIISGRKLSEIKNLVGIPGIIYVGNHGFEMGVGGKLMIYPAAKRFALTMKKIKEELSLLRRIKGTLIEDKVYTLSIHFRLVPAGYLGYFRKLFFEALRHWRGKVKITSGKKVFEIRPPVDWDKGKAVKWIIKNLRLRNHFPIYIGDDKTDEDAFRELKGKGMTIHVGSGTTLAKMRIKNIKGVYRYLRNLFKNES